MGSKPALLIYNPLSGRKYKHKQFPLLLQGLKDMGYIIELYQTTDHTKTEAKIIEACTKGWDAIFVAGGDGTVNRVVQILACQENRPKLGIFPFGTSNEFAKFIGMTADISKALNIIKKQMLSPIDIGRFGNRYFVNIAAAGWLAEVVHETPIPLKWWLGEFAYYLSFIKKLLSKQSNPISIKLDSDKIITDISFFMIINGNSVGPFNKIVPDARVNDGLFHLIICNNRNRILLLFALIAQLLKLPNHSILRFDIQSSEFTLPKPLLINLDGDQVEISHHYFQVIPQHLRVFTPT